jgi:hypothetical protein
VNALTYFFAIFFYYFEEWKDQQNINFAKLEEEFRAVKQQNEEFNRNLEFLYQQESEQVIIYALYCKLLELQCIPLCLEHDGFLVLSNNQQSLKECRNYVLQISKLLVGVEIDLESKDKTFDLKETIDESLL